MASDLVNPGNFAYTLAIKATMELFLQPVTLDQVRNIYMKESLSTFVSQNVHSIRQKMLIQHADLDVSVYYNALFDGIKVANIDILELANDATLKITGESLTELPLGPKFINRINRTQIVAKLFETAFKNNPNGNWIECGVWQGYSSLIFSRIAKQMNPSFDGSGMYMLDSFEGLSDISDKDHAAIFDSESNSVQSVIFDNDFTCGIDEVASRFQDYPNLTLIKGWIPDVLVDVPEKRWNFVHIDVDLYEPTLACIEYFYDRLQPEGIIICDDYITPLFPGAMKAWDIFCEKRNISFAILDSGQSLIIKKSE